MAVQDYAGALLTCIPIEMKRDKRGEQMRWAWRRFMGRDYGLGSGDCAIRRYL